jgi:maltose O-acetyltransferase
MILAHSRPGDCWLHHMGERQAAVRIGRHAAVYAGAIVTPGVTVGEGAIVMEGAVVTDNVPAYTVVAGNPGRVIEELPRQKAQLA